MPGSISYAAGGTPINFPSASVGVFRWDPPYEGRPVFLPNIRCISIRQSEGSDPGAAHFRYVFSTAAFSDPSFPTRIEQTIPLSATGGSILLNDDRILVYAQLDDGSVQLLFDGFYIVPQVNVSGNQEQTTFTCPGAMFRQWDTPLAGAIFRDADQPTEGTVNFATDWPIRFNPEGHPNATGTNNDASPPGSNNGPFFPVFLGPVWPENKINDVTIRKWTLEMAAYYIIMQGTRPLNGDADKFLQVGDLTYLHNMLRTVAAISDDAGPVDMNDPSTFNYEDIFVHDCDVTGEAWPDALMRIIEPHGFSMRWILSMDNSDGFPTWTFKVFRKDDNVNMKRLFLQPASTKGNVQRLDTSQTSALEIDLARDIHDLANNIIIDAKPILYECSFVLAPLFKIDPKDVDNQDKFDAVIGVDKTGPGLPYRTFGFDECGEGHWDVINKVWVPNVTGDLEPVLDSGKAQVSPFVVRRRPGLNKIVQLDDENDKIEATLHFSFNWSQDAPAVWDGKTGTWYKIWSGEWKLLDDRLGIQFTMDKPNSFDVKNTTFKNLAAKLCLIESLNGINAGVPEPLVPAKNLVWFMLTCTIQGDQDFNVVAKKRSSSPTRFSISRRIDKREQFELQIVSKLSYFFDPELATKLDDNGNWIFRDDTKDAQYIADGYRRYREAGDFRGTTTLGYISVGYSLGDKIYNINGRNISLRTNIGSNSDSPIYPSVVGITWNLGDGDSPQSTEIELSDRRHEPPPRRGMRTKE